jgi:hypothetical protein
MFQNLILQADEVERREAELRAAFAASGRPGTFDDNATRVIGQRMLKRPRDYVEFGPYWWAVKATLNEAGYAFGDAGDSMVASAYCGDTPVRTLVAGELFKDYYRATFLVGTTQFELEGNGEFYELADPDMQARIAAAA